MAIKHEVYCIYVGSKNCLDFCNTYHSIRELSAFQLRDDNKLFNNCHHKWYISLLPCIQLHVYLNFPGHGNGLPVYETSTITDRLITCSCRICFCVLFGFFFFFFFWGYRELNMDCAAAFLACITLAWNNTSQLLSQILFNSHNLHVAWNKQKWLLRLFSLKFMENVSVHWWYIFAPHDTNSSQVKVKSCIVYCICCTNCALMTKANFQ